jgi:hypothetical protein
MKMTRSEMSADECLRAIARLHLQSESVIDTVYATGGNPEGVLSSLAVEAFADSQEKFTKGKGIPLGYLAETLTCQLTSTEDFEVLGPLLDTIHFIPILYAHGHVSENYINIQKEAYRIDTVGGGD